MPITSKITKVFEDICGSMVETIYIKLIINIVRDLQYIAILYTRFLNRGRKLVINISTSKIGL